MSLQEGVARQLEVARQVVQAARRDGIARQIVQVVGIDPSQLVQIVGIDPSQLNVCKMCFEEEAECQCHVPREVCEAVYAPIDYEEEEVAVCQGDGGILVRPVAFDKPQKDVYHFAHQNTRGAVSALIVSDCRRKPTRYDVCETANDLSVALSNAVGHHVPAAATSWHRRKSRKVKK